MNRPLQSVVVYGPQGCGKSMKAPELLQQFGCVEIVDEWDGQTNLHPGQLALTHLVPPYQGPVDLVVPYAKVT